MRVVRSTLPSPLPRASANAPVLDAPSTVHVLVATGPDAVWQTYASSRITSVPAATVMRRMAAFVQLPGPHGWTDRSCVTPRTIVAGPNPSSVPVPVLMIWKTPRSATRFVIDAADSVKLASRRFAWFGGAAAACSVRPLASAITAETFVDSPFNFKEL